MIDKAKIEQVAKLVTDTHQATSDILDSIEAVHGKDVAKMIHAQHAIFLLLTDMLMLVKKCGVPEAIVELTAERISKVYTNLVAMVLDNATKGQPEDKRPEMSKELTKFIETLDELHLKLTKDVGVMENAIRGDL